MIEQMNIEDLKEYKKNSKTHPEEQIKKIAASIQEFGFNIPILIDPDNVIIAGHGRLLAAKYLKLKRVPVIRKKGLTPDQIKAYRIADNKTSESDWEEAALKDELKDLLESYDFDETLTGFDDDEISELLREDDVEVVDDEFVEVDAYERAKNKTKIKLGDIFELGDHRLMCGDSTERTEGVGKLIKTDTINLLFTDPPYGISVVGSNGSIGKGVKAKEGVYSPIIGDDTYFDPTFLLRIGEKQIIWGANYFHDKLPLNTQWLVWDKDRPKGTTFGDCELAWTNKKGIAIKKYKCTWNGMVREGESDKRVHPTQKPLKICFDIIQDFSEKDEIVLDLFGGSGSTLIACEQLNRKCFMMELDPIYCEVICERWEKLTGQKRKKL